MSGEVLGSQCAVLGFFDHPLWTVIAVGLAFGSLPMLVLWLEERGRDKGSRALDQNGRAVESQSSSDELKDRTTWTHVSYRAGALNLPRFDDESLNPQPLDPALPDLNPRS